MAAGHRLTLGSWSQEQDVNELVAFLEAPHRHHPVVVFATPEGSANADETAIPVRPFIRRTVGFVHTVVITSEAAFSLTDRVGREFSVYRQAISNLTIPALTQARIFPPIIQSRLLRASPIGAIEPVQPLRISSLSRRFGSPVRAMFSNGSSHRFSTSSA